MNPNQNHSSGFMLSVRKLAADRRGASSVEYLIVMCLVAFVVYAGYQQFGDSVNTKVEEASGVVDAMELN